MISRIFRYRNEAWGTWVLVMGANGRFAVKYGPGTTGVVCFKEAGKEEGTGTYQILIFLGLC